jgi:outer membrane receptor protein involved in Fe transport
MKKSIAIKRNAIFIYFSLLLFHTVSAQEDTAYAQSIHLNEYVFSFSDMKETEELRERPVAGTFISADEIEQQQAVSLKELSSFVPNFYIPDYGSKITSSIYVRGIGSRIDQPAVGLYVDGIPLLNKNAFDFDLYEIKSIEVLRGPQGTLYGRNTLGGIINVRTDQPEVGKRHTNLFGSYGNYDDVKLRAAHYTYIKNVALSVSGYLNKNDGFFINEYSHSRVDDYVSTGGRAALNWKIDNFALQYNFNYDHTNQGGYPYAQLDPKTNEVLPISYNDKSNYKRNLFNNGLLLKWNNSALEISSATGYQYLDDRMDLDQDFTISPVFTISQMQKEHAITEEILFKPYKSDKNYQWLFGLFGFYKKLNIESPITFKEGAISGYIERGVNSILNNVTALQSMNMNLDIVNNSFLINNDFEYPTYGAALFHQSVYKNLFVPGLTATAGIRFDYEKTTLTYDSNTEIAYLFPPMLNTERDVLTSLKGEASKDFYQLIPKVSLKYDFDKNNNVYASVSKGYKTGGFNTQMFADVLQVEMQNNIKEDLYNQIPDIERTKGIKETLKPILVSENELDVNEAITYDPEYSWNYEIGAHLSFWQKRIYADIALFYIDCKDQQITVFSANGMGRMMKNAGQTESYGVETAVKIQPVEGLWLNGAYGYTHATFLKNDNGQDDYTGNHVPLAPQNTFSIGGDYSFFFKDSYIDQLVLQIQYSGVGRIYWTEKNDVYQDSYGLLNGSVSIHKEVVEIELWAKNILNKAYNTFYFANMGNGFVQKGKPFQIGVSMKVAF